MTATTLGPKLSRRAPLISTLSIAAVAALALAGCSSSPEPAPGNTTTLTANPDDAAKGAVPDPALPVVWPLTGLPGDIVNRPAMTIKIANSNDARPQIGIEDADIVFEEMVEGGITRFAAMFHSKLPESVGPIRSIRPMDGDIGGPTHGLIVFSGGIPDFIQISADAGLQTISQDGNYAGFRRDSSRKAPVNVIGTPQTFLDQADANHQAGPQPVMAHALTAETASAIAGGTPASSLNVEISQTGKPNWTWDAASSTWLRDEKGVPAKVASGAQLSAVNVVVMRVQVVNTGYTDAAGSPVPKTILEGTGDVTIASGGKTITGTWSKPDTASPIAFAGADGKPLTLAPGNTWVELVPASGSLTVNP